MSCGLRVSDYEFRVSLQLPGLLTRNPELATRNMIFKTKSVKQLDNLSVSELEKVRFIL
jgi:hypothetical protein